MMAVPQNASVTEKLTSYLTNLNPIPSFPEYTGPYKVGTVDVEIPVSELESPAPAPDNATEIETVQFRVFYPAQPNSHGKRITWLPAPQRHYLSAYIKFLGIGSLVAEAVSFLPRHLHYTTIPAIKNAPILEAETPNKRWPTAVFSHGLGGNRNMYSQVVGSLASHGVVVICPEHRDGSAVASFVRIPSQQNRYFVRNTRRVVPYEHIPHDATDEIYAARCNQLQIRLWELGLVHDAILGLDKGLKRTNLNTSTPSLDDFINRLHVHEPGSIIFAGHSFGASSIVQFLKSVYYAGSPELASMAEPLYSPSRESLICKQITPQNVTMLLDMWCFPLLAPRVKPLFDLPLPMYADVPSAPGGAALLAVDSEAFFKWKEHLHVTARVLSPNPAASVVKPGAYERPSGVKLTEPNFFYVVNSAHANQSDFGLLFPWLTKKVFGSEEPERVLRLNARALLQVLRLNNVPIARTWFGDLVDGASVGKFTTSEAMAGNKGVDDGIHDDKAIFDRSGTDVVEAWKWVDIRGMGDSEGAKGEGKLGDKVAVEVQEPEMAGEIEPQISEGQAINAIAGSEK
ncbi:platelet-activating factor acetylhydrolase, isoform II-domain-containing protein [Pseudomassariella vexata]|uniref:Putative phospholipase n=1 Tax=Pseudomassariella vexata TaxID=1141098 RepID=A0A1Y2EIR1_9PEZI|nr:platelet-activating factor acetylhydrolase, isoform II-domain-containing protein [Pseudomassariella vexata]ORY71116.1 platelet-activating factor acetylhydrolase, isoform II-domain-containing protein [Pseudomassariella vexata]